MNALDFLKLLAAGCLLPAASACTSFSYYAQSIHGQIEIIQKRQPIGELLSGQALDQTLAARLETALRLRNFASAELGLPDNGSYRYYADLEREYVVWNVFAAPELLLEPVQWCFLIAGCLNYRGYFSEAKARQFARDLEDRGYDVYVGGVVAYSTLGWFDDPVLNTMLRRDEIYLARVIFHELAHQKLYIGDDPEFNEAFADTVAIAGVRRWLDYHNTDAPRQEFELELAREQAFVDLVMNYRERLESLYRSAVGEQQKRRMKSGLLEQMVADYRALRANRPGMESYDHWFSGDLNNARLLAVATYRRYLPGFLKLLGEAGDRLESFYLLAEKLGDCTRERRRHILVMGETRFQC